jgi:hypothetical protein
MPAPYSWFLSEHAVPKLLGRQQPKKLRPDAASGDNPVELSDGISR